MDEHGAPLSLIVTGANRHDVTQVESVLDGIVIERPEVTDDSPQHLCADKGYFGEPAEKSMVERHYIPHVRQRGEKIEAKRAIPGYRARRWIVESCHSWFNRFRKLIVRYHCCPKRIQRSITIPEIIAFFGRISPIDGRGCPF